MNDDVGDASGTAPMRPPVASGQPPTGDGAHPSPAIELRGITKRFPGVVANSNVNLTVAAGSIHSLIGENGAGKSTLMKVIAGVEQPTAGQVLIDGQPVQLTSVSVAAEHGVGIIFQELNLCPNLSVLDNLFLAQELTRGGTISDGRE